KGKPYQYDTVYLPHDADNETVASDITFMSVMRANGFKVDQVPKVSLEDGINAARMLFTKCVFDQDKCAPGIEALQNYKWGYNERMGERKETVVHDWASHGADAFRYLALAVRKMGSGLKPKPLKYP